VGGPEACSSVEHSGREEGEKERKERRREGGRSETGENDDAKEKRERGGKRTELRELFSENSLVRTDVDIPLEVVKHLSFHPVDVVELPSSEANERRVAVTDVARHLEGEEEDSEDDSTGGVLEGCCERSEGGRRKEGASQGQLWAEGKDEREREKEKEREKDEQPDPIEG